MLELKPVVVSTKLPKDYPLTSNTLVRIDSPYIVIPVELFHAIRDHITRLDYDYSGGTRLWKLHKDAKVSYEMIHRDHITAMEVARLLTK